MVNKSIWSTVSVMFLLALSVWGKPKCRIRFRTEVVCAAGNDDYTLRRGLVSDNNITVAATLKDCRITDVEQDAFKNMHRLKEIDLARNKISNLKVGVFDDVSNITALRLSRNLLTTIPLGLFDNLSSLERLDLSDNNINILEAGLFQPLTKLIRLELSGMAFLGNSLNSFLFSQNVKLKYLRFSNNNMSEAPDTLLNNLEELAYLALNNCSLTEVPKFATVSNLKTLKDLQLQDNKIKRLDDPDTFCNLKSLELLDLMGNLIENINGSIFKPLSNLTYLYLSNNKIKQIPENLFHDMANIKKIDLSINFMEVVPINAFLGTYLVSLDLSSNRISYLEKNFCSNISCCLGRLSKFYFHNNPFQCACLNEIVDEVKKMKITYKTNSTQEENMECLTTSMLTCIRPEEKSNAVGNGHDILL